MSTTPIKLPREWIPGMHDVGLDLDVLVEHAGLSGRDGAASSTDTYFRLWKAAEDLAGDPCLVLRVAERVSAEVFSEAMFAALRSPNLGTGLERLERYMPLASPTRLQVGHVTDGVQVQLTWPDANEPPPAGVAAVELAVVTRLARIATGKQVRPIKLVLPRPDAGCGYSGFFGVRPEAGRLPELTFSQADVERPFLTFDRRLWSAVEPELTRRLEALGIDTTRAPVLH